MATPKPKTIRQQQTKEKFLNIKTTVNNEIHTNTNTFTNKDDDDDFYHVKQYKSTTNKTIPPLPTPTSSSADLCDISSVTVPLCRHLRFTKITTTTTTATTSTGHQNRQCFCCIGINRLSKMQLHCGLWRWCLWLIMVACVLSMSSSDVMAAPQSCILCDKNDLMAKTSHSGNYEEYLFEHQVTRHDAINALKQLNESFYDGIQSDSSCNAVSCTEKVMKYCLGPQFINDHCLCEVGHSTEGLPFVPHICYVGEKLHTASVGSCFFYEEVKECCCSSLLAKEWRHISTSSSPSSVQRISSMFSRNLIIFILFLNLFIRS